MEPFISLFGLVGGQRTQIFFKMRCITTTVAVVLLLCCAVSADVMVWNYTATYPDTYYDPSRIHSDLLPPAVLGDSGSLLYVAGSKLITALYTGNGSIAWTHENLWTSCATNLWVMTSPYYRSELLIASACFGATALMNGKIVFSINTTKSFTAVADGMLIFTDTYEVSGYSDIGFMEWRYQIDGNVYSVVPAAYGKKLVAFVHAVHDVTQYALVFDAASGIVEASVPNVLGSWYIPIDPHIALATVFGNVVAVQVRVNSTVGIGLLNVTSGTVVWATDPSSPVNQSPIIGCVFTTLQGDYVIAVKLAWNNSKLFVLSLSDGKLVSTVKVPASVTVDQFMYWATVLTSSSSVSSPPVAPPQILLSLMVITQESSMSVGALIAFDPVSGKFTALLEPPMQYDSAAFARVGSESIVVPAGMNNSWRRFESASIRQGKAAPAFIGSAFGVMGVVPIGPSSYAVIHNATISLYQVP